MATESRISTLVQILHSDDAARMKSVILESGDTAEMLLAEVCVPLQGDAASKNRLAFLREHRTLLEAAFCTMAENCLHQLLAELLNNQERVLSQACPLHCLVSHLTAVKADSTRQEAAVQFLERLQVRHSDFLVRCMDSEARGCNALEWAVMHRQLRIAHWILASPRYLTGVTFVQGLKERRLDLTDYSFPWGKRLYRNPLNLLAEIAEKDVQIDAETKRFLETSEVSAWTEHVTGEWRRIIASKIIFTFVCKFLYLLCGCIAIYRGIYFGSSYHEALAGNWTQQCAMLQIFRLFSEPESVYHLINVLSLFSTIVLTLDAFCIFSCVIVYLCVTKSGHSKWRLLRVLNGTLMDPKFTLSLTFLAANVTMLCVYQVRNPQPHSAVPAEPETFWKYSNTYDVINIVNWVDWLVFIICWTTLVATAFEWMQMVDQMCLVWKTAVAFQYFALVIFLAIVFGSWVIGSIVPCEPSLATASQNPLLSIWTAVYKTLVFSTMTKVSNDRMGVFAMIIHVIVCLFLFNFLVAIMAERIATMSADLRSIALVNRLAVLFTVQFSLAWLLRRWPPRSGKRTVMVRVLKH